MSKGWKKWECPPDMLTVEEKLTTLQMTERQVEEISLAYYDYEMNRAATPEQKAAWAQLSVRKKSKLIKSSLQEGLVEDFQLWLQGRSKYNVKYIKESKLNPLNGRYEEMTRECTPWGNKSLLHLDDVCAWLKLPTLNRDKVAKAISILKMTTPLDLEQAWIYYKYIVRGVAIDGQILKEQRYANVFDYIEKQPQVAQVDPRTGRTNLVNDGRFTPYSMNNPSMPKFDEKTYRQNYNHFNAQLGMGNLGAVMDEAEKFDSLTHDDKLVLLIKGATFAKPDPILEMPGEIHEVDGAEAPVAKVTAGPYILSSLAGTLADALGDAVAGASSESEKKIQKTIDMLVKIQKEQAKAQIDTNHVLLEESKRATGVLEGIRNGTASTLDALREFKDTVKVMTSLMERDKTRRALSVKPAINMMEAVVLNEVPPIPAKPVLAPPLPPKPRELPKEPIEPPRDEIPAPLEVMEPIDDAPDVEDAAPVKVAEEKIAGFEVDAGIRLPRLKDRHELVNRAFEKAGQPAGTMIADILNKKIGREVMLELSQKSNGNPDELKRLIQNEAFDLFEARVESFKDKLNKDINLRGHVFNHLPNDPTMHEAYLDSVYQYAMDTTHDVEEKRTTLSHMRTLMMTPSVSINIVAGVPSSFLKEKLDKTIKSLAKVDMVTDITIEQAYELKGEIIKKHMDGDTLSPDSRLAEFEEAAEKHHTLGVNGPIILEAMESTTRKANELEKENEILRGEVNMVRELLNNPDAGSAETIKKMIETIGKYQVYTNEQEEQLNTLRGAAQKVEELDAEKNRLEIEMRNLMEKNRQQAEINQEATAVIQDYEKMVAQYKINIENLHQQMAAEQAKLSTELRKYQELSTELHKSASERMSLLAQKEQELGLLQQRNAQILHEYQVQQQQNNNEKIQLIQKINELESKYAQVSGPDIENLVKQQTAQNKQLEEQLAAKTGEYNAKIVEYNQEMEQLRNKIWDAERKAESAGQQTVADKQKIESLNEEIKNLQQQANQQFSLISEHAQKTRELENALSLSETDRKQRREEYLQLHASKEALEAQAKQLIAERDTQTQYLQDKEKMTKLGEERLQMELGYREEIRKLNSELESVKSELESAKNSSKKIENEETAQLKKQISDLKTQLETNERTRATLEETKNKAYDKNNSQIEKIKEYAKALEARYSRSERIRAQVEKMLSKRRETMKDVDDLADKFQEGLRYMASETHSENLEKMFAYKDDSNALTQTRAGKALVDSWNMLRKFKEQKNRDMSIIEKQAALVKKMEGELAFLKKKNKQTIESYEKQIASSLKGGTPYVTPVAPDLSHAVFNDNYAGIAKEATEAAAKYIDLLDKSGGPRAVIPPDHYPQVLQKQQELSGAMTRAVNERANLEIEKTGLEERKEQLLMKEAEILATGQVMTAQQKYEFDLELARIERQQAIADRGIYALEEHINTFNKVTTFYGGLLSGKTQGTTKKQLERDSPLYFAQAQNGSIEAAKTAGLNIMNAYNDAIRTTPGLLYSLSTTQLKDYANCLAMIAKKLENSTDPESVTLRKRMEIEYKQLEQVAAMDPAHKKRLSDTQYESAYNTQARLRELGGTKGDIEDQQLEEMENPNPEDDPNASFAPTYEEQQIEREEVKRIIGKALSKEALTHKEAKTLDDFVARHGGVHNKNLGTEILQVVRSKIIDTYMETLDNPDAAISNMFKDTSDSNLYKLKHLVGNQVLIKRTLDDLRNIAQEHSADAGSEKNTKIIQALANKSPEILNELLTGTIFAKFLGSKSLDNSLASAVEQDLAKYRIKNEKSIEEITAASEYIASSLASQDSDPNKLLEYIRTIENETLSEKESFARASGLETPMAYLLNKGNIENQALQLQSKSQINGVDSESYEYVSSNLQETDKQTFAVTMSGLSQEIENYASLNTAPYVQAIQNLIQTAKRAVNKKLLDEGKNPYAYTVKNPLPDIKRLYDNTKAYSTIIANLESMNYGSSGEKKEKLVRMIRNAGKSILYDTQRALRDVERLKVRGAEKQVSVWDLRAAIVKGRQETKANAKRIAEMAMQKSKAY
jgi:hypothetical protein